MTGTPAHTGSALVGVAVGDDLGTSEWLLITQEDIDLFARSTRDHDPMHVDPVWAAEQGPFPTTVAFGFLTLALTTHLSHQARPWPPGWYGLNYGVDRVRFIAPVPVDTRVRGHFRCLDITERPDGGLLVRTGVTIEREGEERPALVAEWLGVMYGPASA